MAKNHSSLALEALLDIEQSCNEITDNFHKYKFYKSRCSWKQWFCINTRGEILRINAFRNVLFTDAKFSPFINGPVVDQLSLNVRRNVASTSSELCNFLQDYTPAKRWQSPKNQATDGQIAVPNCTVGIIQNLNPEEARAPTKENSDFKQASSDDIRHANWNIEDGDNAKNLCGIFRRYIDHLVMQIELDWWNLPLFQSTSAMEQVMKDQDAAILDLSLGISIQRLIVNPSKARELGATLEMSRNKIKTILASRDGGRYDLVKLDGRQGQVYMIKYKSWRTSSEAAEQAALVNEIFNTMSESLLDECKGFLLDQATSPKRIGFASQLPASYSRFTHLYWLSNLFTDDDYRPDFGSRLRLAVKLSKFVRQLHLYGLTCGALRSDNIYFLPRPSIQCPPKIISSLWETCSSSPHKYMIDKFLVMDKPKLFDFELAQPERLIRDAGPEDDLAGNIYCHPACYKPQYKEQVSERAQDIYGTFILNYDPLL